MPLFSHMQNSGKTAKVYKMARDMKFWIKEEKAFIVLSISANKDTDQLCGKGAPDFGYAKAGFLMTQFKYCCYDP